jgi:hypothetical protein
MSTRQIDRILLEVIALQLDLTIPEAHEHAACQYKHRHQSFCLAKSASPIDDAMAANSIEFGGSYFLQFHGEQAEISSLDSQEAAERLRYLYGIGFIYKTLLYNRLL